jgi:uncharacterized protein (TIGR03435 family)
MQCNELRKHFADYVKERLPAAVQTRLAQHLTECGSCTAELDALTDVWVKLGTLPTPEVPAAVMNARFHDALEDYRRNPKPASRADLWYWAAGAAASVLLVVLVWMVFLRTPAAISTATVDAIDGAIYRTWGGTTDRLEVGAPIKLGEELRSEGGAVLELADGSLVEMRSESVVTLESAIDGLRIRLKQGSVIVTAAEQREGHLYVQTKDMMVSVVGTVFMVNAEEGGSRVAVMDGKVRVLQGNVETTLTSGEEAATTEELKLRSLLAEIPWSRGAAKNGASLVRPEPIPPLPASQRVTAGAPKFEVASLKVEARPAGGARTGDVQGLSCTGRDGSWRPTMSTGLSSPSAPRGRCLGRYIGIQMLLAVLYDVPLARVTGALPNWRIPGSPYEYGFSIDAVAGDMSGVTQDQLRQMLKALLIERLKLNVRVDRREADGFALTIAPGGVKMPSVSYSEETLTTLTERPRQQVINGKTSMRKFVDFLPTVGSRCTIVDKTGLDGIHEYTLTLHVVAQPGTPATDAETIGRSKKGRGEGSSAVSAIEGVESCAPLRGRNMVGAGVFYEYTPSFNASLEQQLGLRLEPQKVQLDYIVIDGVSEPAEN